MFRQERTLFVFRVFAHLLIIKVIFTLYVTLPILIISIVTYVRIVLIAYLNNKIIKTISNYQI